MPMTSSPGGGVELTVVVPTFDELSNIAPLLAKLGAALVGVDWEVIFVDDDSPDGTPRSGADATIDHSGTVKANFILAFGAGQGGMVTLFLLMNRRRVSCDSRSEMRYTHLL